MATLRTLRGYWLIVTTCWRSLHRTVRRRWWQVTGRCTKCGGPRGYTGRATGAIFPHGCHTCNKLAIHGLNYGGTRYGRY